MCNILAERLNKLLNLFRNLFWLVIFPQARGGLGTGNAAVCKTSVGVLKVWLSKSGHGHWKNFSPHKCTDIPFSKSWLQPCSRQLFPNSRAGSHFIDNTYAHVFDIQLFEIIILLS